MGDENVAIVGAGYATNKMHMPAWKRLDAEVIAICDLNKENAEQTANNWGIPKVYTDFKELLEKEKDAIIDLSTPPSTHKELSIMAMESGHDLIIEKPMTMNIKESKEIFEEYKKRKEEVNLCVVRNVLFNQEINSIRSQLKEKEDEVLAVDIRAFHTPQDKMISDKDHWCHSLPGGRFGECLIHSVYIICDLLNEYDEVEIENIWTAKRGPYDWVDFDELVIELTSERKCGTSHISFNSPVLTWPPAVRVYGKNSILKNKSLESIGENENSLKSKLAKKLDKSSLFSTSTKDFIKDLFNPSRRGRGHVNQFREFLESIKGNKEVSYTPEEAFKSNRLFLKALKKFS